jgi:ubiquinone/menaquinone biosynthesis C-methylase UbiE
MTFDALAPTYDADFTHRPLALWLRGRVHTRLAGLFQRGQRVLELGCGTGEDAAFLARQGVHVHATDASPAMLEEARRKCAGLPVTFALLDLNAPQTWPKGETFDGVYSNFGALNCTPYWAALGVWWRDMLPAGGKVGLGLMSRLCPVESLWHLAHGHFKTAVRRWRGHSLSQISPKVDLRVYYPTPLALRQALGADFSLRGRLGVGVILPTSDAFGALETRPRLRRFLVLGEQFIASAPLLWAGGDHLWLEFERV